jgi:hypothetical protein
MIGHLGPAQENAGEQRDDGHHRGETSGLAHGCATCAGVAGMAFAAPMGVLPLPVFDSVFATPVAVPHVASIAVTAYRYFARAPPVVL